MPAGWARKVCRSEWPQRCAPVSAPGTAAAGDPEWDNMGPITKRHLVWRQPADGGSGNRHRIQPRGLSRNNQTLGLDQHPERYCQFNWLENKQYSPGRLVPNGVEVVAPLAEAHEWVDDAEPGHRPGTALVPIQLRIVPAGRGCWSSASAD